MATTDTSAPSTSSAGRSIKSQKNKKKIIILRLSADLLSEFPGPHTTVDEKPNVPASPSVPSSPAVPPASIDNASETGSTPVPAGVSTSPAPPSDEQEKKGISGPKPGSKRPTPPTSDATTKPRGKPGPKKKPRLEDGTIDPNARPLAPATTHKLGPKASQGAINAGLRALDRTGKPCRKWGRKTFQLKSFTGVMWQVPTWTAPPKPKPVDDSSDAKEQVTASADEADKENKDYNGLQSEKSNSTEADTSTPAPSNIESSPAPAVAVAS